MKQETLEEAANREVEIQGFGVYKGRWQQQAIKNSFKEGAKWQQERSYSKEEVENLIQNIINEIEIRKQNIILNSKKMTVHLLEGGCIAFESSQNIIKELFKQFKKK